MRRIICHHTIVFTNKIVSDCLFQKIPFFSEYRNDNNEKECPEIAFIQLMLPMISYPNIRQFRFRMFARNFQQLHIIGLVNRWLDPTNMAIS